MADIVTIWNVAEGRGDWQFDDYIVSVLTDDDGAAITDDDGNPIIVDRLVNPAARAPGNDLRTAVLISLFTDAVATPDDGLPADADPRGWWGAPDIGSRLWLHVERAKQQPALLLTVRDDIRAALAWLIDDGVAARVEVDTEFTRPGMLGARVTITRAVGGVETLAFAWAWRGL